MLALPHAISLMGLRAACVIIPCYTLFSMWTMHLLTALFVEYKARKVRNGVSGLISHVCARCMGFALAGDPSMIWDYQVLSSHPALCTWLA